MTLPPKSQLLNELRAQLAKDLETATSNQKRAMQASTHEEARQEDSKDMRSTEASYLARGLARRVAELREAMLALKSVALERPFGESDVVETGALVALEEVSGKTSVYLLAPAGGGLKAELDDTQVRVITPRSPIGQALIGRELDEEFTISSPSGPRTVILVGLG